jgi:hypothetical protein
MIKALFDNLTLLSLSPEWHTGTPKTKQLKQAQNGTRTLHFQLKIDFVTLSRRAFED